MAKEYSRLSKENLLRIIAKLESNKKYGLVWDQEHTKEEFEKAAENAVPVLTEDTDRMLVTDPNSPTNILIEGDNYHALSVLNYTHKGKIDIIYIDPPYNTGNRDFQYNDCWVDKEDTYRHSKWLSFMSKRLILAKRLLKETGVMFISIDENEYARLKLLCDQYVFSDKNYVGTITWERKRKGSFLSKKFTKKTEYILIYSMSGENTELFGSKSGEEEDQPLIKRTNAQKTLVVPTHLIETKLKDGSYPKGVYGRGSTAVTLLKNVKVRNGKFLSDLELEGPFIWTQANLDEEVSLGAKFFIRTQNLSLRALKGKESQGFKALSSLMTKDVGTNEDAKTEVAKILGVDESSIGIDYPKPSSLILRLLESYQACENPVVLDFFAGSGTTGHALLRLNKELDRNGTFILCTNDENGICTRVCYPRLKNVIKGTDSIGALGGNLRYFQTSFVKKSPIRDEMRFRITKKCTELLCLREGIFDEKAAGVGYKIFQQGGRILSIYYAIERDELCRLKQQLDQMDGEKILYCFTLDPFGLDKDDFLDWPGVRLEPIPQKILDIYEGIHEH